ncbi:hypothetical protein FGO68_gene9624 [Halteria grandinella]|uniref:1-phosphatidylinositol 4-kinase n=1 Tax=Halteria grandinella TaxID=5974 RepID=A0A8J8P007_HALGN|nr:hypothetical protein FGO68_gene9624 [Halteria grandinella]
MQRDLAEKMIAHGPTIEGLVGKCEGLNGDFLSGNEVRTYKDQGIFSSDQGQSPFFSTLNLMKAFTDLSEQIIKDQNRETALRNGLIEVNKLLPASVYIPFFNDSMRNQTVLRICEDESRIFMTKERAPFMICIEVYRPYEEIKFGFNQFQNARRTELMDRLLFNKAQSVKQIVKTAEKLISKPIILHQDLSQKLGQVQSNIGDDRQTTNAIGIRPMAATHVEKIQKLSLARAYDTEEEKFSINVDDIDNRVNTSLKLVDLRFPSRENDFSESEFRKAKPFSRGSQNDIYSFYQNQYQAATDDEENGKIIKSRKLSNISESVQNRIQNHISNSTTTDQQIGNTNLTAKRDFLLNETSEAQYNRIKQSSPYKDLKTWNLLRIIVKSGDDLRQEQFAMQMISLMHQIFQANKVSGANTKRLWLKPYEILATKSGCGIIEFLPDTLSIDYIKKKMNKSGDNSSLLAYFEQNHGKRGSAGFEKACKNFCYSLAAYCLVCYILQIKDRHNANILVDREGHIVHIDFGFMLTRFPGNVFQFEQVPFKLTSDFMDVMGGVQGEGFKRFRKHFIHGFYALHKNADKLVLLVQMLGSAQSDLPCFSVGGVQTAVNQLRQRLCPKGSTEKMLKSECIEYADRLIMESNDNWRTHVYDRYQYCCQGIF